MKVEKREFIYAKISNELTYDIKIVSSQEIFNLKLIYIIFMYLTWDDF